jgi:hypothetical protein
MEGTSGDGELEERMVKITAGVCSGAAGVAEIIDPASIARVPPSFTVGTADKTPFDRMNPILHTQTL